MLDHALVDIIDDPLIETREWDVKLITTNSLKDDILSASISDAEKLEFLTEAQPRFMWQISYATKAGEAFRLFDNTTASSFTCLLRRAIIFDRQLVEETAAARLEAGRRKQDLENAPAAADLSEIPHEELDRKIEGTLTSRPAPPPYDGCRRSILWRASCAARRA